MQEVFWFFLGGFVYILFNTFFSTYKKIQFINETKVYSFKLIAVAYQHMVFAMATKYVSLENSDTDEEKIKLYKNIDENAFDEWKKEAVTGLKEALPPIYKEGLELDDWNDLMDTLQKHHEKALRAKYGD